MTLQEISRMIASVGLPYAYDHFTKQNTPGKPPFICFYYPESDNFAADDRVYQKILTLRVELYTERMEPALMQRVEEALDAAGLIYDSTETYLNDEKMHMAVWETDVIITSHENGG